MTRQLHWTVITSCALIVACASRNSATVPAPQVTTSSARASGPSPDGNSVTIPIRHVTIVALRDRLAICQISLDQSPPVPQLAGEFYSLTYIPSQPQDSGAAHDNSRHELSLIVPVIRAPTGVPCLQPYRAFQIRGPLAPELVGIIASLVAPLAHAGISVFTLSTYNTDYVLTNEESFSRAQEVLRSVHHTLEVE